jgi:acyl-coenzyme A synthetase/AMP-(fatty) acid ligase
VSRAADGNYLFLGRLDRQVKRRGFRIELGEIETALAGHEDILEAAVVAVEDGKLGTAIIAFVRSRSAGVVTLIEAKAHCARTLPLYMVPDHIVFLDAIPKGSRGKIDYIALSKMAERLDQASPNQALMNDASNNAAPNHASNNGDQDRSPAVHR